MSRAASPKRSAEAPALSPSADALRRLRRNPVAVSCVLYLILLLIAALGANFLGRYPYDFQDTQRYLINPAPPDANHWLGTDELGRDVWSRLIFGARVSLGVAAIVISIEALIGITLGLIAGYRGGKTDLFLMRLTDIMFAFPDLLLAILLSAIVRSGNQALPGWVSFGTLFFALGVVGWPGIARLVRAQAMALRDKEFTEAARATGVREKEILLRHLLPNISGPIIVQATQDVATVILAEATLSFLGLGIPPPFPSWGAMINDALPKLSARPMLIVIPGAALALTVMVVNFLGDALRDAFDPRLRQ
jgi:ABC-type dipeptide/oligopeptide/nickel transport system permease subunit